MRIELRPAGRKAENDQRANPLGHIFLMDARVVGSGRTDVPITDIAHHLKELVTKFSKILTKFIGKKTRFKQKILRKNL